MFLYKVVIDNIKNKTLVIKRLRYNKVDAHV